jgi:hypothetical protein
MPLPIASVGRVNQLLDEVVWNFNACAINGQRGTGLPHEVRRTAYGNNFSSHYAFPDFDRASLVLWLEALKLSLHHSHTSNFIQPEEPTAAPPYTGPAASPVNPANVVLPWEET